MPRRILPLTDTKVRSAKPSSKIYKLFDGNGLYLAVNPTGGKLWHLKYRFEGKEKLLSIGAHPHQISLSDARQKRESARQELARGIGSWCRKKGSKTSGLSCD